MSAREKIKKINELLEKEYGRRVWRSQGDPLSVLISTILSQNTSDDNSHRSYSNLKKVFGSWKQVEKASVSRIAGAIKSGGLSNVKARRIKGILSRILSENNSLDISFLKKWRKDKAKSYLRGYSGVGDKTAACVLLFSLGKPSMPVDTHIFRVCKRIDLLPLRADFRIAHEFLDKMVPARKVYQFHMNLISHGRMVCRANNPHCQVCVLYSNCRSKDKRLKTKSKEAYAKGGYSQKNR